MHRHSLSFPIQRMPAISERRRPLEFDPCRTLAEAILLGAGCSWHVEFALRRLPGILSTEAGYVGGDDNNHLNSTYSAVYKGDTHHAEVVKIVFDPTVPEVPTLLDCFLAMYDATTEIRALGNMAVSNGQ